MINTVIRPIIKIFWSSSASWRSKSFCRSPHQTSWWDVFDSTLKWVWVVSLASYILRRAAALCNESPQRVVITRTLALVHGSSKYSRHAECTMWPPRHAVPLPRGGATDPRRWKVEGGRRQAVFQEFPADATSNTGPVTPWTSSVCTWRSAHVFCILLHTSSRPPGPFPCSILANFCSGSWHKNGTNDLGLESSAAWR